MFAEKFMNGDIKYPEDITAQEMKDHSKHIKRYLKFYLECMIIPKSMGKKEVNKLKEDIDIVKELIKKLKNKDRSVFKDEF